MNERAEREKDVLISAMNNLSDERIELLAQVANLYYEQGLGQTEIADQLQVSRSSVSRLLSEARETGVVEIRINFPLTRDHELEQALLADYSLEAAYVLNTKSISAVQSMGRLARLASSHLQTAITNDMIVGLSWGNAVLETIQAIRRRQSSGIQVVQVIGAAGANDPRIDGPDLARQLAERLGGQYFYLNAPLIVEDSYVREGILGDQRIRKTLDLARRANILLVGIGSTNPQYSALLRAGYITEEELHMISSAGAVGDFCGYHIDIHGTVVETLINKRVVGISLDNVRAIPQVVGVARGLTKAPTILGTLRGGLVNVLVTDDETTREVLRLASLSQAEVSEHLRVS